MYHKKCLPNKTFHHLGPVTHLSVIFTLTPLTGRRRGTVSRLCRRVGLGTLGKNLRARGGGGTPVIYLFFPVILTNFSLWGHLQKWYIHTHHKNGYKHTWYTLNKRETETAAEATSTATASAHVSGTTNGADDFTLCHADRTNLPETSVVKTFLIGGGCCSS